VKKLDKGLLLGILSSSSFWVCTFVQLGFLLLREGFLCFSSLLEGSLLLLDLSLSFDLNNSDVGLEKFSSSLSLSIRVQLDEESKIPQRILSVNSVF